MTTTPRELLDRIKAANGVTNIAKAKHVRFPEGPPPDGLKRDLLAAGWVVEAVVVG